MHDDKHLLPITVHDLWQMVKKQLSTQKSKKIRLGYQHKGLKVDIDDIAMHMEGKVIEQVDVTFGEDTIVIHLGDGSSIEIIVDSIYADVPVLDD